MPVSPLRRCVGVFPAEEQHSRRRLLAALGEAYSVDFECRQDGEWGGLDGLLIFGRSAPEGLPSSLPVLHALGEEQQGPTRTLGLSDDGVLARPLRGARLTDGWISTLDRALLPQGHLRLASDAERPVWIGAGAGQSRELVCAAPAELAAGEALRERLVPGRCIALLALAHFLEGISRDSEARPQPLRAAFVLDDPNLHWPSYGHVSYRDLSSDALAHGYHVAVAMVPLDGWLAHPRVVRIFKEHSAQLSICVHGNDHDGPELGRIGSDNEGVVLAMHALQRARAFQRRTGIPVERVMVPPHEALSRAAARGLLLTGYEAVCASRPYPWIAPAPGQSPLLAPPERGALAGWTSPEIVAGGLPLLLRMGFNVPHEELVLRAFLGQPLILYGHHDLLEHGLDVLSGRAAAINSLGEVRWGSLAAVARSVGHEGETVEPAPAPTLHIDTIPPPRPRLSPLLRRIATEGRDRAQAVRPSYAARR
jgi:hypothetical protein